MPGRPSRELGTKEHKKRYLRGEEIWCQLVRAPGGASRGRRRMLTGDEGLDAGRPVRDVGAIIAARQTGEHRVSTPHEFSR